jgi:hypothetical protein
MRCAAQAAEVNEAGRKREPLAPSGANSFLMPHPFRTPGTGIHNAARYHDKKGRPTFSSGRLRYGRVPYDTFPDTLPVRCAGTTRSGAPCKKLGCAHEDALSLARRWQSSPDATTLPGPRMPYQLQARWTSASLG